MVFFLGDGTLGSYYIRIYLNSIADKEYISYVERLCRKLFKGASISVKKKGVENCMQIQISSIRVVRFLAHMNLKPKKIPEWIYRKNSYIRSCIRGLFDTEGSISFKVYKTKKNISLYKQLNFRNANQELMKFIRDSLLLYGFKPTDTLKRSLYLSTHKEIETFRQIIGFSNQKLIDKSFIVSWDQFLKLKHKNGEVGSGYPKWF